MGNTTSRPPRTTGVGKSRQFPFQSERRGEKRRILRCQPVLDKAVRAPPALDWPPWEAPMVRKDSPWAVHLSKEARPKNTHANKSNTHQVQRHASAHTTKEHTRTHVKPPCLLCFPCLAEASLGLSNQARRDRRLEEPYGLSKPPNPERRG